MTFESPSSESIRPAESTAPGTVAVGAPGRVAVLVDQIAEEYTRGDPLAPVQSTERVVSALASLGYEPVELPLQPGKADEWVSRIIAGGFEFAFNLCETVGGLAEGEHRAAAAVELLDLPMTGASSATLLYCLDKNRSSAVLRTHGITVPDWLLVGANDPVPEDWSRFPGIVKPALEDASNGVHPTSVVRSTDEIAAAVERLRKSWDKVLVQEFIEGREINLAIVGRTLLPPAEIDFSTLPDGSPAIVSFEAKWMAGSPEDLGTRPVCPAPLPAEQAGELQRLAGRVWRLMGGAGYARVDVRLKDSKPYVIDINPNPDLSPDAGLARQARVAGWSYEELIRRIVEDALNGAVSDEEWELIGSDAAAGEAS
jgi:D-alanine-D-alanine ligase